MALQLGALRDALVNAGASPDKAGAAAEEVAAYWRGRALAGVTPAQGLLLVLAGYALGLLSAIAALAAYGVKVGT